MIQQHYSQHLLIVMRARMQKDLEDGRIQMGQLQKKPFPCGRFNRTIHMSS